MNELIKKTKGDTSLNSSLDINSILSNTDSILPRSYLIDKTLITLSQEINDVINSIHYFTQEQKDKCLGILTNEYMYIYNLCDLNNSHYLKLIPRDPSKKQTGGVLVGVKILTMGIDILVLSGKRILQYKYDNYYIFQKFKYDDLLILLLNLRPEGTSK